MKLQGKERLLWPDIWISHYDFGMGCDPLPLRLMGSMTRLREGGHTPKWNYSVKKGYIDQLSESITTISEWGVTPSLSA